MGIRVGVPAKGGKFRLGDLIGIEVVLRVEVGVEACLSWDLRFGTDIRFFVVWEGRGREGVGKGWRDRLLSPSFRTEGEILEIFMGEGGKGGSRGWGSLSLSLSLYITRFFFYIQI